MTIAASSRTDDFLPTRWSLVIRSRQGSEEGAAAALNDLCSIYWYPIYAYVRRSGNTPEEAEDLTQAYFENLLSRGYLDEACQEKGKLRAFLLTDLKLFLSNERRRANARKRGGGVTFVPVDRQWAENRYAHEPSDTNTPAEAFDRRWALTLLGRVLERLRLDYVEKGRENLFEALRPFLSWNSGGDNYAEVASRLAPDEEGRPRTVDYVKKNVERLRKRYRKLLEDEVAQTVGSPEDMADEIRHLAAAIC